MEKVIDFINWDERFILGIPVIDRQHKELVETTNKLHYACLRNAETANELFIKTAGKAVEYVKQHFSTEEKMMILFNFSGYKAHKLEHESFIKEILNQSMSYKGGRQIAPRRFVYFLKDWILSHIAVCDKRFTSYILSMKEMGKLNDLLTKRPQLAAHISYEHAPPNMRTAV